MVHTFIQQLQVTFMLLESEISRKQWTRIRQKIISSSSCNKLKNKLHLINFLKLISNEPRDMIYFVTLIGNLWFTERFFWGGELKSQSNRNQSGIHSAVQMSDLGFGYFGIIIVYYWSTVIVSVWLLDQMSKIYSPR